MALPINKLERGKAMMAKNPLAFKAAVHQNFGIKSRRASKESDCPRSKRFYLQEELLKEIVASGCFSDIQEKKFELRKTDCNSLQAELKQANFIGLFNRIEEILNERINEMLSHFDFRNSKTLKGTPAEFIAAIKLKIKDGLENITNRFKAFCEIAFALSCEANNPLDMLENCRRTIKGNKHMLEKLSKLRIDIFNQLTRVIMEIGNENQGRGVNDYFKLHTQKINGLEETFVAPTQKLYEKLINGYPYSGTESLEVNSKDKPAIAYGCPAAYVTFKNNTNMIIAFMEWFEHVTEQCFFNPMKVVFSTEK